MFVSVGGSGPALRRVTKTVPNCSRCEAHAGCATLPRVLAPRQGTTPARLRLMQRH